jgi:hypothetical protein
MKSDQGSAPENMRHYFEEAVRPDELKASSRRALTKTDWWSLKKGARTRRALVRP